MLSQIGLIYLFCSLYYYKAGIGFFLSFVAYQGHTINQLASLAESCIIHWFELFYKIPLILYCEPLQRFAKEKRSSFASLAESCIIHSFELFYKIPLILYCEPLQCFAKEKRSSYFISVPKSRYLDF